MAAIATTVYVARTRTTPFQFNLQAVTAPAPKTFDLLASMVESDGRLLSKHDLMRALWDESFVEEGNLTYQVSTLRKALGAEGNTWIETVPKHGYRFLAPVERLLAPAAASPTPTPQPLETRQIANSRHRRAWIAPTLFLLFAASGMWSLRDHRAAKLPVQPIRLTAYPGSEIAADFSPDGSQIVFAWNGADERNYNLWVKLAGPGEPIRLTDHPADDLSPAWSPEPLHCLHPGNGRRAGGHLRQTGSRRRRTPRPVHAHRILAE